MGKRELLLIVAFVAVGALVYQVTAPPAAPGARGFSLGRLMDEIRREVRGRPASADITRAATHPVPEGVTELRVTMQNTPVVIVGEDRSDIATELWVRSNGVDEAEAKSLAERAELRVEPAGPTLTVSLHYPPEGSQRGRVRIQVPSAMLARFGTTNVRIEITGVSGVSLESARGEVIVRQIAGRVEVTHRGGDFTVEDAGSVRLTTRGSDLRLGRVRGEASLTAVSGDVRARELFGPVEIDATNADLVLEDLQKSNGPFRIIAVNGEVTLRGLRAEARIDGRGTDIAVTVDRAAPVAIFTTGGRTEIVPPPGGYTLDVQAADGRLLVADELAASIDVRAADDNKQQRASGAVHGGGPTLTVRATRGEVRLSAREPE